MYVRPSRSSSREVASSSSSKGENGKKIVVRETFLSVCSWFSSNNDYVCRDPDITIVLWQSVSTMISWEGVSLITSSSFKRKGGSNKFCKEWSVPLWATFSSKVEHGGITPASATRCNFSVSMISSTMVSSSAGVSSTCEKEYSSWSEQDWEDWSP